MLRWGVFRWLVDVQNVFGVELSATTQMSIIVDCARFGIAVVNLWVSPWE